MYIDPFFFGINFQYETVTLVMMVLMSGNDKTCHDHFCNTLARSGNVSLQWDFITNFCERISAILLTKLG